MSVFVLERSQTSAANKYDHAINLIDTTKPKDDIEERGSADVSPIRADSGTLLSRQITKGHGTLRKELARRKYAKYQAGKDDNAEIPTESNSDADISVPEGSRASQESERIGRLRDKIPFRGKKRTATAKRSGDSFVDVLYENQRGSFFCGIPLYSSNSLLNFDPSAWQNANFQDSAVNITNFQLPDPTWTWDWKTWYVDMSHDVDDQGWEYSFSFNKAYSWHGNHPWLFSFVRRRRWLRRRVKIRTRRKGENGAKLDQAHLLNEDYFTIHATKTARSRESSGDRTTTNRSSYLNGQPRDSDDEQDLDEITNISQLMLALRKARVDREKIAALKAFLNQGGDELYYLADAIPEIMEMFVHQTSRRQLQTCLLQNLDATTKKRKELEGKNKGKTKESSNSEPEAESEAAGKAKTKQTSDSNINVQSGKVDNLLKTIHAAGVHVNDLAFWSDLRARATSTETDPTNETHALDATETSDLNKNDSDKPHSHSEEDEPPAKEEIKGIPDSAVLEEPRLRLAFQGQEEVKNEDEDGSPPRNLDKGKGKA